MIEVRKEGSIEIQGVQKKIVGFLSVVCDTSLASTGLVLDNKEARKENRGKI